MKARLVIGGEVLRGSCGTSGKDRPTATFETERGDIQLRVSPDGTWSVHQHGIGNGKMTKRTRRLAGGRLGGRG